MFFTRFGSEDQQTDRDWSYPPREWGGMWRHGSGAYQSAAHPESSRWRDKISEVKFAQLFSVSASLPENLLNHSCQSFTVKASRLEVEQEVIKNDQ